MWLGLKFLCGLFVIVDYFFVEVVWVVWGIGSCSGMVWKGVVGGGEEDERVRGGCVKIGSK